MLISALVVLIGLLILAARKRLVDSIESSGRSGTRAVGGPFAWWGDAPSGSKRLQIQRGFATVGVLVVGIAAVVIGVNRFLNAI